MHTSRLSRRRFLALSGTALALPALNLQSLQAEATDMKELAKAINKFAGSLHARLGEQEKGSLFFSPFSVETALAMTSAGARGPTLEEMQKTLHLPADPHPAFAELLKHLNATGTDKKRGCELTTANAIWAMQGYPWRKEFIQLTTKNYGAGVIEVDFAESEQARKRINDWVEKETKEKIKELIPAGVISALTRMVLTNAIYFKGNWAIQFDKKKTKDAPFHRADRTKADVPLMQQTGMFNHGQFTMYVQRSGEEVQVLELPYAGNELSMQIFLPKDPGGAGRLAQWLGDGNFVQTELKKQRVRVSLPRFKAESNLSLKPVLMELGMKAAFSDRTADFSGMHTGREKLFISHVLHKAFVDVNEEGTEAAAATAVVVEARSAPQVTEFRADRPFVFVIRDNKTGTALFMGRYSGPVM
jgi:serpin B